MASFYRSSEDSPEAVWESAGPEVGKIPYSTLPEVTPEPPASDTEKMVRAGGDEDGKIQQNPSVWRRQKVVFVFIVVAILAVIAIIVGVTVGITRRNKASTSLRNDSSDHMNTTSTNKTTPISPPPPHNTSSLLGWRVNNESSLGVTGWGQGSSFNIRLFYQDNDGFLRISSLSSSSGKNFSEGIKFASAKRNTPLAASCHNTSIYGNVTNPIMETHVFYLDSHATIQEYIFHSDNDTGRSGPLNSLNARADTNTRLASYWPSLVYQNSDNSISELRYNCTVNETNCWHNQNLVISGPRPGAAVAEVPQRRNMSGLVLFYQREDENVVGYKWSDVTGQWSVDQFAQPLPPSTRITVLATPRMDSSTGLLKTYVLWQSPSNNSILVSSPGDSGWSAPAVVPAFQGAMKGTSLACLTASSWRERERWMPVGESLRRCYYLGKGEEGGVRLREAQIKRDGWSDNGVVEGI